MGGKCIVTPAEAERDPFSSLFVYNEPKGRFQGFVSGVTTSRHKSGLKTAQQRPFWRGRMRGDERATAHAAGSHIGPVKGHQITLIAGSLDRPDTRERKEERGKCPWLKRYIALLPCFLSWGFEWIRRQEKGGTGKVCQGRRQIDACWRNGK